MPAKINEVPPTPTELNKPETRMQESLKNGMKKDAEDAEKLAEQAAENPQAGEFNLKLERPVTLRGKTFSTLHFDFSRLSGADFLAGEDAVTRTGRTVVLPAFQWKLLEVLCARACTDRDSENLPYLSAADVDALPLRDFQALCEGARDFMLGRG